MRRHGQREREKGNMAVVGCAFVLVFVDGVKTCAYPIACHQSILRGAKRMKQNELQSQPRRAKEGKGKDTYLLSVCMCVCVRVSESE